MPGGTVARVERASIVMKTLTALSKLLLRSAVVGPWGLNSYALICPDSGESMLFDPGADLSTLVDLLSGSKPKAIAITHSHADHIGALQELCTLLGVPVIAHPGADHALSETRADIWLGDDQSLALGRHRIVAQHAPGHTDDQVCYRIIGERHVLVGDTIFEGGPGKTWSSEGFSATLNTLRQTVLRWPDDTICHPGHGSHFILGSIRADIEGFLSRDHGAFYGDATWVIGTPPQH